MQKHLKFTFDNRYLNDTLSKAFTEYLNDLLADQKITKLTVKNKLSICSIDVKYQPTTRIDIDIKATLATLKDLLERHFFVADYGTYYHINYTYDDGRRIVMHLRDGNLEVKGIEKGRTYIVSGDELKPYQVEMENFKPFIELLAKNSFEF